MTGMAAGAAALSGGALGWWGAAVVVLAAATLAMVKRTPRSWAAAVLVVTAAAGGAWRAESHVLVDGTSASATFIARALVVSAPVRSGPYQHFLAEDASAGSDRRVRVCVTTGAFPELRLGDTIWLNASATAAADEAAGRRAALAARGCAATAFAPAVRIAGSTASLWRAIAEVRSRLNVALRQAAPGDAGVLLSGLVTGDDDGFSPERVEAFRRTNTTHLTAVSGANLALVAGMAATLGAATVGRHRLGWQAATVAAVWLYAAISGLQPPAVRAAIVASAAVLAFRVGRRPDFPTLILLAAGAMVLAEPAQIGALGFRLSVAASLALAVVLPGLMGEGRTWRGVEILAGTAAAQLATLPLLLPVFGTVSLLSLPANAVAAPLAAMAMPIAALAGLLGLIWAPLGQVAAAPAALLATVLLGTVDLFGGASSSIMVGTPPVSAAVTFAIAAAGVLLVLSGEGRRWLRRTTAGRGVQLPAAALAVFAREDPTDAFGADLDDPVENPPGEEDGHQVADDGQLGQRLAGDVVRRTQVELLRDEGSDHEDQEQDEDEPLTPLSHQREVIAAEVAQPFEA
jgi:competence protein ComEC